MFDRVAIDTEFLFLLPVDMWEDFKQYIERVLMSKSHKKTKKELDTVLECLGEQINFYNLFVVSVSMFIDRSFTKLMDGWMDGCYG